MPKPRYIELPDGSVERDLMPSDESIAEDEALADYYADDAYEAYLERVEK